VGHSLFRIVLCKEKKMVGQTQELLVNPVLGTQQLVTIEEEVKRWITK
jgi:hypothetical protein